MSPDERAGWINAVKVEMLNASLVWIADTSLLVPNHITSQLFSCSNL